MSSSQSPSPFSNPFWPKFILLLTAAIGGPAAAIAFFSNFIMSHPVLTAIIGVFYIIILGFIVQVWQKLQDRWVDRCVEWLDNILQGKDSGYRKKYFEYLDYQHRDFDVKGLTTFGTYALELNQIFVELYVNPTTPKQVARSLIPHPRTRSERKYSLWDYLTSRPLNNQHLVVTGSPGSGKTTLLKHITLTLVNDKKYRYYPEKIPHIFPILLFLREHSHTIRNQPKFSLVDALHAQLKRWDQPEPPAGWIKRQLDRKQCLIMLDGLDEVGGPKARQEVANWVQKQMIACRENRFIVTSRPFGYKDNPLSGVTVLEILPFLGQQIDHFIQKWYLANEIMRKQKDDPGVRMKAKAEAEGLLQRLKNTPALLALTANPLLLTMIATVHRYGGGELPGNRMALYAEICEVFLGKRQRERGQVMELKPAQIQLVLEPLAYSLMLKGESNVTIADAQEVIKEPLKRVKPNMRPKSFLQLVENASGLLLEQESEVYSFAHLTFQEYLAAAHIREKQLGETLTAHVEEIWWQETIRLYCAMADATPIITACLRDDPPSIPALTLALDYIQEAREVQAGVKARLETIRDQGLEDADQERRLIITEVLLARRQSQMVYAKGGVYRDTSLVTCAEYQIFLDEQRRQGKYYQPDHWNGTSFPAGSGKTPILGVRRSDALAFCNWLTARNKEGWHYRLPRDQEWPLEERRRQTELHAETGYWVEDELRFVWSQGEPSDILRQKLTDCMVRAFSHAHARARIRANKHDFDPATDLVIELGLVNKRTSNHPLNHALDLALNLSRNYTLAPDTNLVSKHAIALDLEHAHEHAVDLVLAHVLDRTHAYDLYIDLFLLQERISGKLPTYEGILLVKERQYEKQDK